MINTLLNLKLAGSVAAAEPIDGEYRALVCLFLNGGNDSFNMLVPKNYPNDNSPNSEYDTYASVRGDLALAQNTLLPINPTNVSGRRFGIHPNMPELQALFESGMAGFVANVGTLVEPVTQAQYEAETANLPLGLYSHSDQIEQWQTCCPTRGPAVGWAGRMADLLKQLNSNQKVR